MQVDATNLKQVLADASLPCWLFFGSEGSDPYLSKLTGGTVSGTCVAIVTPSSCDIAAHQLDAENLAAATGVRNHVYRSNDELWTLVDSALRRARYPAVIALNYSEHADAATDSLGHGAFVFLTRQLRAIYRKAGRPMRLVSAEPALYALIDRKDPDEIARLTLAATWTHEILKAAFACFLPGMSEKGLASAAKDSCARLPEPLREAGVVSWDYAWEAEHCPIVLIGPNLIKGGHSLPSDDRLQPGQTVYVDFGLTLTFADGSRWSSDLQRMGYALKHGEDREPAEVSRVFSTLLAAIDAGFAALTPDTPGHSVDEAVRSHVLAAGFPDYNHGTGHPIGEHAHNPGTFLGPKRSARARQPVRENGTYTIEPRIAIPNGGSIEEMALATPEGGRPLGPRQTSLYLIG